MSTDDFRYMLEHEGLYEKIVLSCKRRLSWLLSEQADDLDDRTHDAIVYYMENPLLLEGHSEKHLINSVVQKAFSIKIDVFRKNRRTISIEPDYDNEGNITDD